MEWLLRHWDYGAIVGAVGAALRLGPRGVRWCAGLLICNVRLSLMARENEILRAALDRALKDLERESAGGNASPPASPATS